MKRLFNGSKMDAKMITQNEVDLLYKHLHDNYYYEDGKIIRKTAAAGFSVGKPIGYFHHHPKKSSDDAMAVITLNKKRYCLNLAFFVYIYHYKIKPKCIKFVDSNPMNTRVENIVGVERRCDAVRYNYSKYPGVHKSNSASLHPFSVQVMYNRKSIFLGSYSDYEEATKIYKTALELLSKIGCEDKEKFKTELKKVIPSLSVRIKSNKSGFKGVYKQKNGAFTAQIRINKKIKSLGYFKNPEDAHNAYLLAKRELITK